MVSTWSPSGYDHISRHADCIRGDMENHETRGGQQGHVFERRVRLCAGVVWGVRDVLPRSPDQGVLRFPRIRCRCGRHNVGRPSASYALCRRWVRQRVHCANVHVRHVLQLGPCFACRPGRQGGQTDARLHRVGRGLRASLHMHGGCMGRLRLRRQHGRRARRCAHPRAGPGFHSPARLPLPSPAALCCTRRCLSTAAGAPRGRPPPPP